MSRRVTCAVCLAAWLSASALAHDFWIEPSSFQAAVNDLVEVDLRVGDAPEAESVARNPERIEKFVVLGPDGAKPIPGQDGKHPAGFFRPAEPGLHVVGYRSTVNQIELEADKFEAYLREEGLERVIEARAARGESAAPGREIYSRCAKALIAVGDLAPTPADRPLDFRLELIAKTSPVGLKPGDKMTVQLLFDGKPCEGVLIAAVGLDDAAGAPAPVSARTDKDGQVSLPIAKPGRWLISAVHMVKAPDDSGADWESLWASLTFEMPQGPSSKP